MFTCMGERNWCINWMLMRVIDAVRETITDVLSASPSSEQMGERDLLPLTGWSPGQTVFPTRAKSTTSMKLGIVWPPTWLELAKFDHAQIFAQLEPSLPLFGHLSELKPTLAKLFCYRYVTTQLYSHNWMVSCKLAWLDGTVWPPTNASFDFVTWLELGVPSGQGSRFVYFIVSEIKSPSLIFIKSSPSFTVVRGLLIFFCGILQVTHLTPLDHKCLFRRVSTRTSGVPIIFSANFFISLMALGARLLKPLYLEKNLISYAYPEDVQVSPHENVRVSIGPKLMHSQNELHSSRWLQISINLLSQYEVCKAKKSWTHTPWIRLWTLTVYSRVTTSLMVGRPFFLSLFFAIWTED